MSRRSQADVLSPFDLFYGLGRWGLSLPTSTRVHYSNKRVLVGIVYYIFMYSLQFVPVCQLPACTHIHAYTFIHDIYTCAVRMKTPERDPDSLFHWLSVERR